MLPSSLFLCAIFFVSSVSANGKRAKLTQEQVACTELCKPSNTWELIKGELVDNDFNCFKNCFPKHKPGPAQIDSTKTAMAKCKIMGNGLECYQTAFQMYYMKNQSVFEQKGADEMMAKFQKGFYINRIKRQTGDITNVASSSGGNTAPIGIEKHSTKKTKLAARYVDITRESNNFSSKHFVVPDHYENDLESILIPNGLILDRVKYIASQVINDSEGPLSVACVSKGGFQFCNDLASELKKLSARSVMVKGKSIPLSLDFWNVKSYQNDQSTGDMMISMTEDDLKEIKGKHILLVEDIIDTGATTVQLLHKLQKYQPASIRVASLLIKKTPRSNGFVPDYVGFAIPDVSVVGYCLDYKNAFRDLDHVCIISETGKEKYAV